MQYIVMDLEWNGGYSRKAHGYFNEIIEVGAVRLDESLQVTDRFHAAIRPVVSRKLSEIVTDLTNITPEELEDGVTFDDMMQQLAAFVRRAPAAVLTWSTTDLLVLMENCRFFYKKQEIPFLQHYLDAQVYVQRRLGTESSQQLGLARAGELLGIPEDGMSLHRALDDSVLTAKVLQKVADPTGLAAAVQTVDAEFYRRITFKTRILSDIDDPLVKRSDLCFACPQCGRDLARCGKWRFYSRAFCAELRCEHCDKRYMARVQYRMKYEGLDVRRKLHEKLPPETAAADASAGS